MAKATDIPQSSRKTVYERDGHKCRFCGRQGVGVELHHIIFRSQERNNHAPSNLVALCTAHHKLAHTRPALIRPVLEELVQKPYLTGLAILRREKVDIRNLLKGTL